MQITIGCAGWNIAKEHASLFPAEGSHLEKYAALFSAVEINTTFYRLPKAETFQKWAAAVPDDFRFSVKLSREITHLNRLINFADLLPVFLKRIQLLETKLGPLLVQLPPSLAFDEPTANVFFGALTDLFDGVVVMEPRHKTWFGEQSEQLLRRWKIARVAADPALVPAAAEPGGWVGLQYFRWHGSPEMYYSSYEEERLEKLARKIETSEVPVWCIFDNTASGAAVGNARWLKRSIDQ